MCCSRANLACSDFTRASLEIRSRLLYSSFGEVPIFRCSSFMASESADVAALYSVKSLVFSSQLTCHPSFIISGCPLHLRSQDTSDGAPGQRARPARFLGSEQKDTARSFNFGLNIPHGRTDTNTDRGTRRRGWFTRDIFRRNNRWVCDGGISGVEALP
jgi:hypothetical protein